MRQKSILLIVVVFFLCALSSKIGYSVGTKQHPVTVDLPEEWMTISEDSTELCLMTAYLSKDTLHLAFEWEEQFKPQNK